MGWPASIGIVMHDLPLGGTERIALRLARAWSALGVPVTIFCGDARGSLRALVPETVRLVEAEPPIPRAKGSRALLGEAAAAHFAREPVAMAFVTGNYHWEVVPALAALPASVRPAILVQVSSPIRKPQRWPLRQWLFERRMRRLLAGAQALITLDDEAAAQAGSLLPHATVRTIALPALEDMPPAPSPSPDTLSLVAVGRLEPQKDFPTLLRAFAGLRHRDARLTIGGSGSQEAKLRRLADRLGIAGGVTFAGYVADSRPLLDEARLFVLSSAYEGFGAVLIEALAAGRPVVATDCAPAVRLLLEDRPWGRIVPVGDAVAMAAAIDAFLDEPPSDPLPIAASVDGYRIGPAARAYLDLFGEVWR